MHPIVSEQIARQHRADLVARAEVRRRLHVSRRSRRSLRRRIAEAGFWIARTADPVAVPSQPGGGLLRIAPRH